jgi:hypothetical protein
MNIKIVKQKRTALWAALSKLLLWNRISSLNEPDDDHDDCDNE